MNNSTFVIVAYIVAIFLCIFGINRVRQNHWSHGKKTKWIVGFTILGTTALVFLAISLWVRLLAYD